MSRNRIVTIFLVLGLVVLAAVGSWLAGSAIQSPAEAAARTAPPTPSPILAPVEERVLTSDIVTRGTARFGLPRALVVAPSTLKAGAGVITTLPERNMQLTEGDLLLTASGRPLFVLQGEIPNYRDLVPGTEGADVRQLEEALARLGFDPGSLDETYDQQTSDAVAAWYQAAGWPPFGATGAQRVALRALEQGLAAATNHQAATTDAATTAPLAVEAARAAAEQAAKAAAAEVAAKQALLDNLATEATATAAARATAERAFEVAQAAVQATQLAGEVAIQRAVNDQKVAEREAALAAETVAQLTADLELLQRQTGVQMPMDELVFIPALPVRVEAVNAAIGDAASGALFTVTNNQLMIDSSLQLEEAPLVKPGMKVFIDEQDLGITATGVVARVADSPGTDGVDGFHIYFETAVDETETLLEGFSLRLTVPVESTGGAVLAVPVSALSLAADGASRVQVARNGAIEFLVVEPGLSADGFVEVTPVDGALTPGELVVIGYENP